MSAEICGLRRPARAYARDLDRLENNARDLRVAELARLVKSIAKRLAGFTRHGIDPQLNADKVRPTGRYSSAYF